MRLQFRVGLVRWSTTGTVRRGVHPKAQPGRPTRALRATARRAVSSCCEMHQGATAKRYEGKGPGPAARGPGVDFCVVFYS